MNGSGNGTGFNFVPIIGITYKNSWTYVFINKCDSTVTPSTGYYAFRVGTDRTFQNDLGFSGYGNGYINWNRRTIAGQPFTALG